MLSQFKLNCPFNKRLALSTRIKQTYSDRYPVIIEKCKETDPEITHIKYIVPQYITMVALIHNFRSHMPKIQPSQAIIFYVNNKLVPITSTIDTIYSLYKENDGFLYISYTSESTFG